MKKVQPPEIFLTSWKKGRNKQKVTVILKETVQKQIKRLPAAYFKKVKVAILSLEGNPRPHAAIKLQGGKNEYRIRVGVYRILYSIQDDVLIIYIFEVVHRKQVYR